MFLEKSRLHAFFPPPPKNAHMHAFETEPQIAATERKVLMVTTVRPHVGHTGSTAMAIALKSV